MTQNPLPFDRSTADPVPASDARATLEAELMARTGFEIELVLGRSRRHPVQLERATVGAAVRHRLKLHSALVPAPDAAVEALASWMRVGRRARRACERLDAWIAESVPPVERRRTAALQTCGAHHDLARVRDAVLADPSAGCVHRSQDHPPIGWGRWPTRAPRRRIQLGAYDENAGQVRIHPVLDDAAVPEVALRFVVFHELLHATLELPPGESAHGPSFRVAERAFSAAPEATAWIDRHSGALVERVARRVRAARRSR